VFLHNVDQNGKNQLQHSEERRMPTIPTMTFEEARQHLITKKLITGSDRVLVQVSHATTTGYMMYIQGVRKVRVIEIIKSNPRVKTVKRPELAENYARKCSNRNVKPEAILSIMARVTEERSRRKR
jgi:hypothetical protein